MLGTSSRRTGAGLLVLTVILGFALPVSADAPLPFRGSGDETVTGVAPVGPGLVLLTVTGQGQATHLGQFTGTEVIVLDQANGTLTGSRVFIAANGDQLFADVAGAFTSPTTAEGTFTFTGGTGRFADASGQAAFQVATTDGVHLTLTTDGAIDY